MTKLKTRGFHHITMVSTDAGRTHRFYHDLLGLRMVKKTVNFDDPGAYHLYFGDDVGTPGTLLTFFEWPGAHRGHWGVGGVHHLALSVPNTETQLMWKRRLQDHRVGVSGPYDRGYFHSIYFQDPDGQVLEIATEGPGYTIDEPADALGRREILPPDSRLRGHRNEREIAARTHPEPVPEVTDAMRLGGIHHITGITDDIHRADDFYQEALGLSVVKKTVNQDDATAKHWFWAHYEDGEVSKHSAYTLFDWPGSEYLARPGAGQTHHIAFRAKDREEQEAWRDHLQSLGLEVTPVLDRNYFESIYFRAPDGQLLEIASDGPGFAVDEPVEALGRELRLPEWLEGDRERIEARLTPIGGEE